MSDPLPISAQALSLINNVLLDGHLMGKVASTSDVNDAYARAHTSKLDLCEYISRLERLQGIPQQQVVKR